MLYFCIEVNRKEQNQIIGGKRKKSAIYEEGLRLVRYENSVSVTLCRLSFSLAWFQ